MIPKKTVRTLMKDALPADIHVGNKSIDELVVLAEEYIREITRAAEKYARHRRGETGKSIRLTPEDVRLARDERSLPKP
jgi:histone H3/H4